MNGFVYRFALAHQRTVGDVGGLRVSHEGANAAHLSLLEELVVLKAYPRELAWASTTK